MTAKVLKKFIKQPRPPSKSGKTTYGMPSTHSASIGFMATYLTLACIFLLPHRRLQRLLDMARVPAEWSWLERAGFSTLAIGFASSVWWSRVRLGHHTPAQVAAGAALGSTVALYFFGFWHGSNWLTSRNTLLSHLPMLQTLTLNGGLREQGLLLERILEDAAVLCLEAWEAKNLRLLIQPVGQVISLFK